MTIRVSSLVTAHEIINTIREIPLSKPLMSEGGELRQLAHFGLKGYKYRENMVAGRAV